MDVEIPSIQKLRKQLTKLTLDMDSVQNRLTTAQRQANGSGNIAAFSAKADAIRDEFDEACHRVCSCKDQLSTEMFNFVMHENKLSEVYETFVREQMEYHRSCLDILAQTLPEIHEQQKMRCHQKIYGQSLKLHLKHTNREIATVIEHCVCTILKVGLEEEGLFRINGSISKLKKLRAALNANMVSMEEYIHDIPCVASALKQYIRELPEPLLTYELYDQFVKSAFIKDRNEKVQELKYVLSLLPKENFDNLRYLMKFFARFAENVEITKMSVNNIAIVIGPNLLWPLDDDAECQMANANIQAHVTDCLISYSDLLFPGDIEFIDTGETLYGGPTRFHGDNGDVVDAPGNASIVNQINISGMANVITSLDSSIESHTGSSNASPSITRRTKKQAPAPPRPSTPVTPLRPLQDQQQQKPGIRVSNISEQLAKALRPVAPPPAPPKPVIVEKPPTPPKPKFISMNPFDSEDEQENNSSNGFNETNTNL